MPGHNYESSSASLPPWETDYFTMVRRADSTTSSSSVEEGRHYNQITGTPADDEIKEQYARKCAKFLQTPEDAVTPIQIDTPRTAPPFKTSHNVRPYVFPGPKSSQNVPTFVGEPSPPARNHSFPSTTGTSSTTSPQSEKAVMALPGTMSSRNARKRSRARSRTGTSRKTAHPKPKLVHKWKSMFKEMFTYHPPDETQLERIKDRHWTEEDY